MGIYIEGDFKNPYPNCDECMFGELIRCEAITRRETYDYEVDCPLSEIEVEDAISENAPSVIPQPKESEWIEQEDDYHHYWECSECGMGVGLDDIRNYCPNCGAKMKGAEE